MAATIPTKVNNTGKNNIMYKGKALYNPQGRSGEYSQWAINFYNGCTGGCEYCYNKRFPLLSAPKPTLKACFKDKTQAFEIAKQEIAAHKSEIIKDGGLFLSFVSDPCLPDTFMLTSAILSYCTGVMQHALADCGNSISKEAIPVIILTKQADWVLNEKSLQYPHFLSFDEVCANSPSARDIAFGFTLTGHDELEPGCSSNADRIKAMKILHDKGFRTWASIEPVIDFFSSWQMVQAVAPFCDHFKIGLRTNKKYDTTIDESVTFVNAVRKIANDNHCTVYWKESFRQFWGGAPIGLSFVETNYNIFDK